MESIKNIEREAIKSQKPQPGLVQLMDYLTSKNVQKGICTRNFEFVLEQQSFIDMLTVFQHSCCSSARELSPWTCVSSHHVSQLTVQSCPVADLVFQHS